MQMDTFLQSAPFSAEAGVGLFPPRRAHPTVLVPMLNIGVAPLMLEMAATLALRHHSHLLLSPEGEKPAPLSGDPTPSQARIVVMGVVQVPPDLPLSHGVEMARSYRALLDFLPESVEVGKARVRVDRMVRVAHEVASAVCGAADEEGAGLVLFHWKGHPKDPSRNSYGSIIDATLRDLRCDVALLRPDGWREASRVLLAVRGGPSAERALDLALPIAERLQAPLTVMHNVPPVGGADAASTAGAEGGQGQGQAALRSDEPYILFTEHLREVERATNVPFATVLTLEADPGAALMGEAHEGDLVVMGMAPLTNDGTSAPNLASTLAHERGLPMLVVRCGSGQDLGEYAEEARARRPRTRQDMPFDQWFVENTYHADEFRDPDEFMRLKRASGLTISVGILTSHDEKQTYSVLTGLKRVLRELHPIADEIVVVDAGLGGDTAEIARSLGVDVYVASEVLPGVGSLHGRGESWWKSLAVMQSDIVVWLDPRAQRFHPTTAMALAGPLLRVPTLRMVKAFARPEPGHKGKRKGKREVAAQPDEAYGMNWGGSSLARRDDGAMGGRITVQSLRPADLAALSIAQIAEMPPHTLLQVLYPALAGVVSPFGRDMAGRRETLLDAPALTGENNELGLLLWLASNYGTRAVAQVELRNATPAPPLQPGLKSALDVLQVLALKLSDPEARQHAKEAAARLQSDLETGNSPQSVYEVRALGPVERPPMRGEF